MTSLSKITATSWSAPVSSANTPREVDAVRKSKLIGRHVKPVIGGKVLLTQKAAEFHMQHFRKEISEGRPGIISIIYEDYCWVNWDNGAGSWYNIGRDGRYELIQRPPREERVLAQTRRHQELISQFNRNRSTKVEGRRPTTQGR